MSLHAQRHPWPERPTCSGHSPAPATRARLHPVLPLWGPLHSLFPPPRRLSPKLLSLSRPQLKDQLLKGACGICQLGLPKQRATSHVYCLPVLEAGSLRSRTQQGWFLPRPLSLACGRPSPPVSSRHHPSVRVCVLISSYKDTIYPGLGPPQQPPLTFTTSLKTPPLITC